MSGTEQRCWLDAAVNRLAAESAPEYDRVILGCVKTAVSIPDPLFAAADELARRLGISRSELYARALAREVASESEDSITARLDAVYAETDSALDPLVGRRATPNTVLELVILRGEVWWADLGDPRGSGPGFRRPMLVVSSDAFNRSKIATVVCAVITSNLRLADAPGNVMLDTGDGGLDRPSVVNCSQVVTLDKAALTERLGRLRATQMRVVESGLRRVLSL